MTVDNLLSVDIVLANSELVHASATENPDLFWAIRGGASNFGVVTSFEYRLHPVGPMIIGGLVIHPFARAAEALKFYGQFMRGAPDDLTAAAVLMTGPDGQKACAIAAAYAGTVDDGVKALQPLKEFGPPVVDIIGPIPYVGQQSLLDQAMPPNLLNYWKADFIDGDERRPHQTSRSRHTAGFRRRDPRSSSSPSTVRPVASRRTRRRTRTATGSTWASTRCGTTWSRTSPTSRGCGKRGQPSSRTRLAVCTSTSSATTRATIACGWRMAATTRGWRKIKAQYDPDNLFHLNANIKPELTAAALRCSRRFFGVTVAGMLCVQMR